MSLPLNQVVVGDCGEIMAEWPGNSVDCVVTDPPYRIGFMGSSWDRALPPRRAFRQIFRVLKPGALAFVMSSPRQDVLWRMLAMLEGVGFELKQSFIAWIYRTGFPKAYDVSKGIDRKLGVLENRDTIGFGSSGVAVSMDKRNYEQGKRDKLYNALSDFPITEPASDLAKKWEGWKSQTGLKPALEMILMVNKPRSEPTIVDNVLRWGGAGAINVDACRIPFKNEDDVERTKVGYELGVMKYGGTSLQESKTLSEEYIASSKGRFPANLLISDGALARARAEYSEKPANPKLSGFGRKTSIGGDSGIYHGGIGLPTVNYGDKGSPFRFFDLDAWAEHRGFLDVAKPSRAERDFGLWDFEEKEKPVLTGATRPISIKKRAEKREEYRHNKITKIRNIHATVKPVKLMAYLIELGCPPKGIVVDPFLGSGTTCIAAKRLRRQWIGIEINPEYAEIAEARINIRGPLDQFMEAEK